VVATRDPLDREGSGRDEVEMWPDVVRPGLQLMHVLNILGRPPGDTELWRYSSHLALDSTVFSGELL
jgi:hypothetical protein